MGIPDLSQDEYLARLQDYYRIAEPKAVQTLIDQSQPLDVANVQQKATKLIQAIRADQTGKGGVDALLKEYSLSSEEGVVLMCLAEALLRVPDEHTADQLIRDKISKGDWSAHLGRSDSLFVNASAWGLLMTGKVTQLATQPRTLLTQTLTHLGEPVIRTAIKYAMEIMGAQFVMGTSIDQAIKRARDFEDKGYTYSYDMLGEGARTKAQAEHYFKQYETAIMRIGEAATSADLHSNPGISIKLSALHPRYEPRLPDEIRAAIANKLIELAVLARSLNVGLTLDAEEAYRLELSLSIFQTVYSHPALNDWSGFGLAVQAYQKRAPYVIDWLIQLVADPAKKVPVRLVKGAYWDSEIKWAQQQGLSEYPVFTRKAHTDLSYRYCVEKLLTNRDLFYPQFATHNAYTVATILAFDDKVPDTRRQGFEFQRLHGMGEALYDDLLDSESVSCRIYAPVGRHQELLAYLVRRLLENGANSSFVNNILNTQIPVSHLVEDPLAVIEALPLFRNSAIPLPGDIFRHSGIEAGDRINSAGIDLSDQATLVALQKQIEDAFTRYLSPAGDIAVRNPANHKEVIGHLRYTTSEEMLAIADAMTEAKGGWFALGTEERSRRLLKLADELEANAALLVALCMKEAGKTITDSVSELREAVDFCRYYANQALIAEATQAKETTAATQVVPGLLLCISPWNFPLAIFLGQVAASLAAGHGVIAKPAEQTSLIALTVQDMMRRVGIFESAFKLVLSEGKSISEYLVTHSGINAILFTGSNETAGVINRRISERPQPIPLIAETGGQNAMLVDSTALLEQVVDDVLLSGFYSSGQRCSALRVLFVQEEVAEELIGLIKGAMLELRVGEPVNFETDIGPIIDEPALLRLQAHLNLMQETENVQIHFQTALNSDLSDGYFFPPSLIELKDIDQLSAEVFGPVIHVIRYANDKTDEVIDKINHAGFGLTFGLHSRIESKTADIARRIQAGNVYVNRNMVGAVVGVQPFGGRELSGTGPKAGGPNYLPFLAGCVQQSEPLIEYQSHPGSGDEQDSLRFDDLSLETCNIDLMQTMLEEWSDFEFTKRLAIVEKSLTGLDTIHKQRLAKITQVATRVLANIELPGPTGEDNQLVFEPRGLVLVLAQTDRTHLDEILIATWLAGNVPILVDSSYHPYKLLPSLSSFGFYVSSTQLADLISNNAIKVVIAGSDRLLNRWCCVQLAKRPGAITPLVNEMDLERLMCSLVWEKTISIDTTASGGNASLLNSS